MTHAFSCRWLDKLGLAAQLGHKVVVRQTFFSGNYAMVNKHLKPNPVSILKTVPIWSTSTLYQTL